MRSEDEIKQRIRDLKEQAKDVLKTTGSINIRGEYIAMLLSEVKGLNWVLEEASK